MDSKVDPSKPIIIEEKIQQVRGEAKIFKYQKGKLLGKGGFAKCYEFIKLDTKKLMAAKIIPKSTLTKSRAKQKLISEIKIHKSLSHLHVVKFEHVFEDHDNVYILLELCTNQTLNELIKKRKRLIDLEVQCFIIQIISALIYLHENRVIHRDLKLGNLFINDKMEIKIGDFGLATRLDFDGEKRKTICGTPNYIAPEILKGKGHSYEVDIWSLGVIIYTMLIGKPPYETPEVKTTYEKIKQNIYTFPDSVPIADTARALITRILNLDPSKRPNLNEIANHPFLNTGGTIPRVLPQSILGIPPSQSYLKQFQPQGNTLRVNQLPQRLGETGMQKTFSKDKNNFMSTDKFGNRNETRGPQWGMSTGNNWSSSKMNGNRPGTQSKTGNSVSSKNLPLTSNMQTHVMRKTGPRGSNDEGNKQETWVKSWVDYSSKYGLGYFLSNGSSGVFFNDSTKIVMSPNKQYFEYMERRQSDKQDVINSYPIKDYPSTLQKKITLLFHFKNYLEQEQKQQNQQAETKIPEGTPLVYVKKWMKTKHAIMFRLSNKIVQVNFSDKTEILLSAENKLVTYVNKVGERSNYPLNTALDSTNTEMSKRLKYTREILSHMLNQNQPKQQQQGDQQQEQNEAQEEEGKIQN